MSHLALATCAPCYLQMSQDQAIDAESMKIAAVVTRQPVKRSPIVSACQVAVAVPTDGLRLPPTVMAVESDSLLIGVDLCLSAAIPIRDARG